MEPEESPVARDDRSTPTEESPETDDAAPATAGEGGPSGSASAPGAASSAPGAATAANSSGTTGNPPAESPATGDAPTPESNPDDMDPVPTVGGGAEPESETTSRPAERPPDSGSTLASEPTPRSNARTDPSPPRDADTDEGDSG